MEDNKVIFLVIIGLLIGFLIGSTMTYSVPTTTYNNLDIIREQLQVTQKCFSGWDSTLEILRDCNNLNK